MAARRGVREGFRHVTEEAIVPVVFRDGGLKYYFFSNEGSPPESPHIHVKGGGRDAKLWVIPRAEIADSYGFNRSELSRIVRVVEANQELILKAWHDHFSHQREI